MSTPRNVKLVRHIGDLDDDGHDTSGGFGGAMDDLSDVTLTTPAENDTLRYISGVWVNDARRWEPVTNNYGSGPEMVFDGDDLVMEWKDY